MVHSNYSLQTIYSDEKLHVFNFMEICTVPVMKSAESSGTIAWHDRFDPLQCLREGMDHVTPINKLKSLLKVSLKVSASLKGKKTKKKQIT